MVLVARSRGLSSAAGVTRREAKHANVIDVTALLRAAEGRRYRHRHAHEGEPDNHTEDHVPDERDRERIRAKVKQAFPTTKRGQQDRRDQSSPDRKDGGHPAEVAPAVPQQFSHSLSMAPCSDHPCCGWRLA